jgi:AcrR family transcriptional regulator
LIENETSSRGHGGRKARRIDLFIQALISHASVEDAAAAAKISSASAWRYLQDKDVLTRLRETCRDTMQQSKALLQAASVEAVECLRGLLRDAENESVRVSAAKTLLEMGLRAIELDDIEDRIAKLEAIAKSRDWRGASNDREDQAPTRPAGGVNGPA